MSNINRNIVEMAFNKINQETSCRSIGIGAATNPHRRRYHPKAPLSVVILVLLVLGVQFLYLSGYVYQKSGLEVKASKFHLDRLDARLRKCAQFNTSPVQYPATQAGSRINLRWKSKTGQNETLLLRNATLFDGEQFLSSPVDIVLKRALLSPSRNLESSSGCYDL
jgi:hypothetical protein